MNISFVNEFQLDESSKAEISTLLSQCFTEISHQGRTYFKQLPHYRLLLRINGKIVGQVAIDYRVMNLNGLPIKVFGVIDFAVNPQYQRKGLGTTLMQKLEDLARENSNNIDFIFLVTEHEKFYARLGYKTSKLKTSWLKIHEGKNYGMGNENIDDCYMMHKQISNKTWSDGTLDMLGYWY